MDSLRFGHIISMVLNTPWAILPEKLAIITELIAFRAAGGNLSEEEIRERVGAVTTPRQRAMQSVAIIPIYGVLVPRGNLITEASGATSLQMVSGAFRQALADPGVSSIVFEFDSPGGQVDGVPELARDIYRARGQKPIVAVANTLAASAAYWLATAADQVYVAPSGQVGSIGVIAAHEDMSGMLEKQGVKTTLISAGKYKVEGNPYEPLSDDGKAYIQARVDEYYDLFTHDVAKGRGVTADEVRGGYGQGRVVSARTAKESGMVDGIATLEEVVNATARKVRQGQGAQAEGRALDIGDLDLRARRLELVRKRP